MRKFSILIVRLLPLFLFLYIIIIIVNCYAGIDVIPFNKLHSNSFFYAIALYIISISDKKYHCKWNHAMYIELMVFPLINFLDTKLNIFPTAGGLLFVLGITCILTILITMYLALRHFFKLKTKRYEER